MPVYISITPETVGDAGAMRDAAKQIESKGKKIVASTERMAKAVHAMEFEGPYARTVRGRLRALERAGLAGGAELSQCASDLRAAANAVEAENSRLAELARQRERELREESLRRMREGG